LRNEYVDLVYTPSQQLCSSLYKQLRCGPHVGLGALIHGAAPSTLHRSPRLPRSLGGPTQGKSPRRCLYSERPGSAHPEHRKPQGLVFSTARFFSWAQDTCAFSSPSKPIARRELRFLEGLQEIKWGPAAHVRKYAFPD